MFPADFSHGSAVDTLTVATTASRPFGGDLVTWLQGLSDLTIYQGNHTGHWADGDALLFSIAGQSYKQNRYYYDGLRLGYRQGETTLYVPNLEHTALTLDAHRSALDFSPADDRYISLSGNVGGIGGINPSTVGIVHLFHGTGSDDVRHPVSIDNRQYVKGSGTLDAAIGLGHRPDGGDYRQHLYFTFGQRELPNYGSEGLDIIAPLYDAQYYKVQLDGQLPLPRTAPRGRRWLDALGYYFSLAGKQDGYSEHYFNPDEQPVLNTYSATLYGRREHGASRWTSGVTWTTTLTEHHTLNFARNIFDQDGENLEPWVPDGLDHELTWSARWQRALIPHALPEGHSLTLEAEAYNTLAIHRPTTATWSNILYMEAPGDFYPLTLGRIDWTSRAMAGALLENEVLAAYRRPFLRHATLTARLGVSLDGMLLADGRSRFTPMPLVSLDVSWRPRRWLSVDAQLHHDRMAYDLRTLRYMSARYLNGEVYLGRASFGGTTDLPSSPTGGATHHAASGLWQPGWLSLVAPIKMRFGRHEIALIQTARKTYHTWFTTFTDGPGANGVTRDGIFYLQPNAARSYTVGYAPEYIMGGGLLTGSPYYVSQQTRYTYRGPRLEASIGWQSMMGAAWSPLGSGPAANDVGSLSESTANPNTQLVLENPEAAHPGVGRIDQDRAFELRLMLNYRFNRHFQLGAIGNWLDGQPFSYYHYYMRADQADVAIINGCSKGINPTDNNFGCRESAIFHIDLHARFDWTMRGLPMTLRLNCYNAYDFGNVLGEMCFPQALREGRGHNMCLTIPRGVMATLELRL